MRSLWSLDSRRSRSLAQVPAPIGLLVCGVLSVALAACAPTSQAAPSQRYLPVIHAAPTTSTPTPGSLTYTVGAWPSNSAPAPNGRVTIYVAFRDAGAPVAGGKVSVTIHYAGQWRAFGPAWTNGGGLAAISVPVGGMLTINLGSHEQSVAVSAQVVYHGETYQASTSFTPVP